MNKRLRILLYLIAGTAGFADAQQIGLFTQYMFNPFVINPAIAGTHNYYQIRSNHRFQWVGFTDPPVTNTVSFYGPDSKRDMGFGGYVISDVTGPTSNTAINGSYAYNIAINDEIRLSMGLSIGLGQYKVDMGKVKFIDADPNLEGNVISSFYPDASAGLYMYATNFHVGLSTHQLFPNKIDVALDTVKGISKLKSHFYLTGGYKVFINREWALEPTLIIKKVAPVVPQLDLSCRVIYQNIAWGGLSYRTGDALCILLGYTYQNKIYVGYSYDVGLTSMRKYNSGSHELMLGYRFNKVK
jgi:type IX secretion system PorP/SprF family membrane protein